ncbi:MAG: hypothetical protein ACKODH_17610 [Limisphaerales bacterium]
MNTFLLFLAVNGLLWLADWFNEVPPGQRVINKYGLAKLRQASTGLTDAQIMALQEETWGRQLAYEPFTEFKEAEFQGRHVNVSRAGFRVGPEQGVWPPAKSNLNVFIFGGSTTFGYGVTDADTLPAQLQARLRALAPARLACVYNFGRAFFTSTQERILFQQLLLQGRRPAIAVFVDGVNDAVFPANENALSAELDDAVRRKHGQIRDLGVLGRLPLLRPVQRLLADDEAPRHRAEQFWSELGSGDRSPDGARLVEWVGARFLANVHLNAAAGGAFSVRTLFVWQPCPFYRLSPTRYPFELSAHDQLVRAVYERMARLEQRERPAAFLWLADVQEELKDPLYVDAVHYSPDFNAALAARIADWIKANGWLD